MTVHVMGAGASLHANYPLGRDLLKRLAEWLDEGIERSEFFTADERALIRRRCREPLNSVRLLFPDLDDCEKILRELDSRTTSFPMEDDTAVNLPNLRDSIASSIKEFFADTAFHGKAGAYDSFSLWHVRPGDVIITFNYDIALELALKKAGCWHLNDGYGMKFPFASETPTSKVTLLKLHGSVNWHQRPMQEYLPPLIPRRDLDLLGYTDLNDPRIGPDGFSVVNLGTLILPDQNKTYYWEGLWEPLWKEAAHALATTQHLVIHGYSVPVSDSKPRQLFFETTNREALIEIYSLKDSDAIALEFRQHGFKRVTFNSELDFETWTAKEITRRTITAH